MFLKRLLAAGPLLFFDDGAGGAGGGGEGTTQGNDEGGGAGEGGDHKPTDTGKADDQGGDSANKLIKDFVRERGTTVEALLKQITDQEESGKTELEKATSERDKYKGEAEKYRTELVQERARGTVMDAAKAAGAISSRAVYASIAGRIAYNDAGSPTNVDTLIEALKKEDPDLFGTTVHGSADGGAGGDGTATDMNDMIRRQARRG